MNKPIICPKCQRRFSNAVRFAAHLQKHQRVEAGIKPRFPLNAHKF